MHTVLETESFAAGAKALDLTEEERLEITQSIAKDPTQGDLIVGTGGARKIRFRKPGTGKSSGYRVITYFAAEDVPVFLLEIFDKNVKINLSKSERNEFKKELGSIAEAYREAMQSRVKQIRKDKVS